MKPKARTCTSAAQYTKETVILLDSTTIEGYTDRLCLNALGDMLDYMKHLIDNAKGVKYEERYGRKAMELLLQEGMYGCMMKQGTHQLQLLKNDLEVERLLNPTNEGEEYA